MKKKYIKSKTQMKSGIAILSLIMALVFGGCFNLDEKVFDEVTQSTFTATQNDVIALMASGYTPLC